MQIASDSTYTYWKNNKWHRKFSQDNNYNRFGSAQAADAYANKARRKPSSKQKNLIKEPNEVGCCLFFKEK